MPTPSNNYKPFLSYLSHADYGRLKLLASKNKTTMTQIVREAVLMRLNGGSYVTGFNDGLECAIATIGATQYSQMRFPSGKSFAELVADELAPRFMKESKDETNGTKESVSELQEVLQQQPSV
mgnify:CR=1 FL=1